MLFYDALNYDNPSKINVRSQKGGRRNNVNKSINNKTIQ